MQLIRFLLLIALSVSACAAAGDDEVRRIAASIRQGNFGQAVESCNVALAEQPRDKRLLTLRAIALEKQNKSAEALASFREALRTDPAYIPALRGAVQVEYRVGDAKATADLDRLLSIAPDDGVAHAMRGALAWKAQDCNAAVPQFEAAGAVLGSQPGALDEYGACLIALRRDDQALHVFAEVQRAHPGDRAATLETAFLQIRNQEAKQAIETLRALPADDPEALALESRAHEILGDTPSAVENLRKAIVAAPDRPEFYVQFALLALEHQSFQVGIDMVDAGIERMPRNAELRLARGILLVQQGKYDAAESDFDEATVMAPGSEDAVGAQALAALQADRLDDALRSARSTLKANPRDAVSWYVLSEALLKRGAQPGQAEFTEAAAAARKATELKPDFVPAGDTLARLYLQTGNVDAAIAECRRLLSLSPEDESALYHLVRALRKRGKPNDSAEAARLLQRLQAARAASQQRDAQASRFRLIEPEASR